MSLRNYLGCGLTVALAVTFYAYVHRGGELTAAAGLTFGGGAIFCGLLMDFDHFLAVLKVWKGEK